MLFIYRFTHQGRLKALPTLLPLVTGPFNSTLKPFSAPWGVYSVCNKYALLQANLITRTISALTGTHLPVGGEKQLLEKVSYSGTQESQPGLEPTLCLTETPTLEFSALIHSATTRGTTRFEGTPIDLSHAHHRRQLC